MLIDTRLTLEGACQADAVADALDELGITVDLVVTSPLSRALETTKRAFARRTHVPIVAHPALRERQKRGADLGRERRALEADYGAIVDFGLLPVDGPWGYTSPALVEGTAVPEEEDAPFVDRLTEFVAWLCARPEGDVAIVCHKGVVRALTGQEAANCEIIVRDMRDLNYLAGKRS